MVALQGPWPKYIAGHHYIYAMSHGERAIAQAYIGFWGGPTVWVQGAEPKVRELGGKAPP